MNMNVRYTIKDYTLNKNNKALLYIIDEKDKQLCREEYKMRKLGLCPIHRIFLNAMHKCDCCD